MYDQSLFLTTLSRFASALPRHYDTTAALHGLTVSGSAVLGLAGCGVTLADAGRLHFITGGAGSVHELEEMQERFQAGPGKDAYEGNDVVSIADVRLESARWPDYARAAARLDVAAVAGIPMRLAGNAIGALNLYSTEPRSWTPEDLEIAQVMADLATGYAVNSERLRQQQELTTQLQGALESRITIEQAKGIIANHRSITVEEAFDVIRRHARNTNNTLHHVVDGIVSTGLRL